MIFIDIGAKPATCTGAKSIPSASRQQITCVHFSHRKPNFPVQRGHCWGRGEAATDLPADKTTGLDNVSTKLSNMSAPAISSSLAHVFNKSLRTGRVPREMKRARVNLIFEKGDKTDPGNYRPISTLPVSSKILERIVHSQLMEYYSSNNLITVAQSGFRRGHSNQSSLLRITENIFELLSSGNVVGMIQLDLKKHSIQLTIYKQAVINRHRSDSRVIRLACHRGPF